MQKDKRRKLLSPEEAQLIRERARAAYQAERQQQEAQQRAEGSRQRSSDVQQAEPKATLQPSDHTHQPLHPHLQQQAGVQPQTQLPSLQALQTAPRFGLNAKALILAAAGSVTGPDEEARPAKAPQGRTPHLSTPHPSNVPPRLNPTRLLDAVAVPDRHFVTYVPRSNIPRLLRQGTADMLLGNYLGLLVGLCLHTTPVAEKTEAKALEVIKRDPDLRAIARQTAGAQEMALYKQVTNKHAYSALSSKAECSLNSLRQFAPAAPLEQLLAKYGSSTAAACAPPQHNQAPQAPEPARFDSEGGVDAEDLFESSSSGDGGEGGEQQEGGERESELPVAGQQQQQLLHAEEELREEVEAGEEQQQQQHEQGSSDAKSEDTSRQEEGAHRGDEQGDEGGIEWVHRECQEAGDGEENPGREEASNQGGICSGQEASGSEGREDRKRDRRGDRKGDGRQHRHHSRHRSRRSGKEHKHDGDCDVGGHGSGSGSHRHREVSVEAQVAAFVKGLLQPLYKAQLLPKDKFKAIVQRSTQKIMDRHRDAPDASFLLYEHEAIRKFTLKMVEAYSAE